MPRALPHAVASLALLAACAARAEPPAIDYSSVAAVLAALRADPTARFEVGGGWITAATAEHGNPVLWSFTPEGHPAHPAVVKRTAVEANGAGMIQLATLCEGPAEACARLLDDFRQMSQRLLDSARTKRVELDVGISLNEHRRLHVQRLLAEEGKAAEIRMDDLLKVVILPSWDEGRGVLLWTALYGFDGADFRLLAQPLIAVPERGTAELDVAADSGDRYRFSITPLLVAQRIVEREAADDALPDATPAL